MDKRLHSFFTQERLSMIVSISVCMYVYIYIYIYRCICVGLCVCLWMGGQRGDPIFGIFEVAPECPESLSLSILVQRPHKELCPWKPVKPEEGGRTFVSLEHRGSQLRVGLQNSKSRVRLWSRESENQIKPCTQTRWVSIFGCCVGLSLSYNDSYMNIRT